MPDPVPDSFQQQIHVTEAEQLLWEAGWKLLYSGLERQWAWKWCGKGSCVPLRSLAEGEYKRELEEEMNSK